MCGFCQIDRLFFLNAKVVGDRFHVMKLVNQALNKIWIQAQVKLQGSRWRLIKAIQAIAD